MSTMDRHDGYVGQLAHYLDLAREADQIVADEIGPGRYGFAEQMAGAFERGWDIGEDPVEVITDDIICCLPDGWQLLTGDDRRHYLARVHYPEGARVQTRSGSMHGTVTDSCGESLGVEWDADADGGPYEDEVWIAEIRPEA
jgi:hypothetical protein